MTRNRYSERALCFQKIIFTHQLGPLPSSLFFPSLYPMMCLLILCILLYCCLLVWVSGLSTRGRVYLFFRSSACDIGRCHGRGVGKSAGKNAGNSRRPPRDR